MTVVMARMFQRGKIVSLLLGGFIFAAALACGQAAPARAVPGPAETLYLQLRSVGLDPSRVFHARDISIDRNAVHITLRDGTLAFTKDVAGRVTGAFFDGDGEVLLAPPDAVERASMTLFTGAAILEEQFSTGYFRFNDDTFAELKPSLRPSEEAAAFAAQWNETAQNLAEVDALRLLLTLAEDPPAKGADILASAALNDRMLHARLQGRNLGAFDVFYDAAAAEPIRAGAYAEVKEEGFYNVWTSFAPRAASRPMQESGSVTDEEVGTDSVEASGYKIRAEIKLPNELSADASLQLDVRQGGQRVLVFELSRFLRIAGVEADGAPIEFIQNPAIEGTQLARRGNDLVAIVFSTLR